MTAYHFKYRLGLPDYDCDSIINPLHLFIEQYLLLEQRNQMIKYMDLSKPRIKYKKRKVDHGL